MRRLCVSSWWIRLLRHRLILVLLLLNITSMGLVMICAASLGKHLSAWVNRPVTLLVIAHLTVEVAPDTDLISASSGLLNLLAVLTCPDVASQYRLLLLHLCNLSSSVWSRRTVPVPCHATWIPNFIWLLSLRVRSLKPIAIVLRAISRYCESLTLLVLGLALIYVHELRVGWLLNSRFDQFFVLRLINTTYSGGYGIGLCSCSAALVV